MTRRAPFWRVIGWTSILIAAGAGHQALAQGIWAKDQVPGRCALIAEGTAQAMRSRAAGIPEAEAAHQIARNLQLTRDESLLVVALGYRKSPRPLESVKAETLQECLDTERRRIPDARPPLCIRVDEKQNCGTAEELKSRNPRAAAILARFRARLGALETAYNARDLRGLRDATWDGETHVGDDGQTLQRDQILARWQAEWAVFGSTRLEIGEASIKVSGETIVATWDAILLGDWTDARGTPRTYRRHSVVQARFLESGAHEVPTAAFTVRILAEDLDSRKLTWEEQQSLRQLMNGLAGATHESARKAPESELSVQSAIVRNVRQLFRSEQFAALEALAAEYRTGTRTPSGLWKLSAFYLAFEELGSDPEVDHRFRRWRDAHQGSATPAISQACHLIERAFHLLDDGPLHEVQPEQMAAVAGELRKPRDLLEANRELGSKDPQWYASMLDIARGQAWPRERMQGLADEGSARHADYHPIYFSAIEYLLPKWHGDTTSMERFARAAAENSRGEGAGLYARIYWYAAYVQFRSSLFLDTKIIWEDMRRGIDDVLARYPDQWNINHFAHFACLARDPAKARELMARIDGTPIRQAWDRARGSYSECRYWLDQQKP